MFFSSSLIIVGLLSTANCHLSPHHRELAREVAAIASSASSASSASIASGQTPAVSPQPTPTGGLVGPSAPPLSSGAATGTSQLPDATLTATNPNIPPLSDLTSGLPSTATPTFTFVAPLGAPGPFPGAPPLPSTTLDRSKYPSPTELAPTDYPDMVEWLKELEGVEIPDIPVTTNESDCSLNPEAAQDTSRCWWSCGGCHNPTDIVTCEDKGTWGLTFDDGPSPWTPLVSALGKNTLFEGLTHDQLQEYLAEVNVNATFFMIGSNLYWFPGTGVAAYLGGHQIALHTWHHSYMTGLSNMEVIAELGLARKIIRDVFGVTPSYWRPPYGDVDDRVRAIALAMGMQTIIWTRDPVTLAQYDTNDWRIPAGQVNGPQAFEQFETIIKNSTTLDTGFIVLEHDLFEQTVDLAVGYTLPTALQSVNPKLNLQTVVECQHLTMADAYNETRTQPLPQFITTWKGSFTNVEEIVAQSGSNLTSPSSGGSGSGSSSGGPSGSSGSFALSASLGNVILAAAVSVLAVVLKS